MNINHPKDDVREITKKVMIKFIEIFGNKIFKKMQMIIDEKELNKIIQDKIELKSAYENLKNKNNENEEKLNVSSNSSEGIFLTNVNKKFLPKNNSKRKLKPIGNYLNGKIKINQKMNSSNKQMIRSSSLPKYDMLKFKLKPINAKTDKNKFLVNSKSQKTIEISKK